MKKYPASISGLLLAAFLLGAIPHFAHAKTYDADGNPVSDDNDNGNSVYDADEDANDSDQPANAPAERNMGETPVKKFHRIEPTPDMATTPPQPPPPPAPPVEADTQDDEPQANAPATAAPNNTPPAASVTAAPVTPAPAPAVRAAAPVAMPPAPAPIPASVPTATHAPSSKGGWWHPRPGTKWQIQYAGKLDTSAKVNAFDLDLVETDPSVIQQLHNRGVNVICYFSAGSFEGWRPDAREFPASVMGKPNGWKDEKWLDIRRIDILKPIMKARIDMAKQKGCDAVDPDNVEGFENNSGFPLKGSDQLAYNKMLAELAHADGLAVSLKNDTSQVEELLPYFDFQVNEQCFQYKSCEDVQPFIKAGKPVFNIEYKETTSQFCPQANKMNFDSLKKNLDLDAKVEYCR